MESDISKVLTYEVKKELADRYFGFRKIIEEDKEALRDKVKLHTVRIEQEICHDLVRIYILLNDRGLIRTFLDLIGLDEEVFFDPYLLESPTIRQCMFGNVKTRGLTRAGRFKNMLLDGYELLARHAEAYRKQFGELVEEQEIINEEIKLFYKKNDINNIMDFLRALDSASSSMNSLNSVVELGASERLAQKMRVEPPEPIEKILPVIPPLIPLSQLRKKLKKLAERAYKLHGGRFPLIEKK